MWVRASILILLICILSACSTTRACNPVEMQPDHGQVLERFPGTEAGLPRSAMIAGALPADAGNLLARSASAGPVNGGIMLNSDADTSSWVIWGWYGLSSTVFPERIKLSLQAQDEPVHILLADFALKRWRTYGPVEGAEIELAPQDFCDRVIGRDGLFYVAVLASGGSQPIVNGVELSTSNIIEMPAPALWTTASQGGYPSEIHVDWEPTPLSSGWTMRREDCGRGTYSEIPVECCSYIDQDVEPGRIYRYSVVNNNLHGEASSGPPALGYAGTISGARLTGLLQYDDDHPAAGISLQLGNGMLVGSTDWQGRFRFSGVSPGLWTLWLLADGQRRKLGQYAFSGADVDAGEILLSRDGTPQLGWHWIYPPQNLYVSSATDDSVTLKWDSAERATTYEVYRGRFTDPYWAELQASTELTSIALLDQGNGQYYYWVRSREELPGFMRVSAVGRACGHLFPDKGLLPDTIYAVPDRTQVLAGEEVTFTVKAHKTAHPLNFVNSVRVTFEEGNDFVAGSFNPGSVGGSSDTVDGLWKLVAPTDGFLPVDSEVLGQQDPINGRCVIDFNVTPLGGSEVLNATGELFNFRLRVYTDVTMSFQTSNDLLRTYYSDGTQMHENVWTHDDNMGMPVVRVID